MHRFFAPDIASTLTLPEEESRHCVRVLRLVEGDEIEVIDGRGTLYRCKVALAHTKHCQVTIVEQIAQPTHWRGRVSIAVAPTKNLDRIEWMVEKCVEMGVDEVIPVLCDNSERRVLKTERLTKIAVAAMKQSLKATLPVIRSLTPLSQLINAPFDGNRFIAYCDPTLPRDRRIAFPQAYDPERDTLILIGPEGDFNNDELQAALHAGFKPVTLGKSRLRTETAATFACAVMHTIKQLKTT